MLLQHRAIWSHQGGTWGLPGGARDSHESAEQAAVREAHEEAGIIEADVAVVESIVTHRAPEWSYTTVRLTAGGCHGSGARSRRAPGSGQRRIRGTPLGFGRRGLRPSAAPRPREVVAGTAGAAAAGELIAPPSQLASWLAPAMRALMVASSPVRPRPYDQHCRVSRRHSR
ncbi:NUDIX domain-containing protein [Gordonia neofelifaecis]|uniref:NUDIX domain-containing protein n=1 Tax=Gordonia neofelifaecis TaxID=945692 RepID=UPI003B75B942